jgi:hypothetical protein
MIDFARPVYEDRQQETLQGYLERAYDTKAEKMKDMVKGLGFETEDAKLEEVLDKISGNSLQSLLDSNEVKILRIKEDFYIRLPLGTTEDEVFAKILNYQTARGFEYHGLRSPFHQFLRDERTEMINCEFDNDEGFPEAYVLLYG